MDSAALRRVKPGWQLKDADARMADGAEQAEAKAAEKLQVLHMAEQIAAFQDKLYAGKQHKLLIILQGMDTSGKDGTVRAVFGQIHPLGARTAAFRAPSVAEQEHDYLWRVHREVPGSGEVVIFNRSHYEDVLVGRVHQRIGQAECERRYAQIRDFERMLAETGTVILKFFLHISRQEQKTRLEERLADPDKHWKFDPQDLLERAHWDSYQRAYEKALSATDADHAPWYVIPADSKTRRNLAVARIVLEKLASLKLRYPPGNPDFRQLKVE